MGLTIHYGLNTDRTDVESARSLVQSMRQLAKQLPFQEVGDIVEFQGNECEFGKGDDEHRWLKIQAEQDKLFWCDLLVFQSSFVAMVPSGMRSKLVWRGSAGLRMLNST